MSRIPKEMLSKPALGLPVPKNPFTGTISKATWQRAHMVPSRYLDTFDYGVYDRLREKFGKDQPRGGVLFRTGLKLVNNHSSCTKCHYALELDTYGRGCFFNCVYCYAQELLMKRAYWNEPHPFPIDISEIRKTFATVFETDKKSKWRSILTKRTPIRLGSMSDSFLPMDRKYRVTYEVLKLLRYYNYPLIIFTRSDLVADDEYLKLLDSDRVVVQMSICGGNEYLTRQLEPGAPNVSRRLSALSKLVKEGFWTTVRINPLFPYYPDGYYTDHKSITERFGDRKNVPTFPLFDLSFLREIRDTGTRSVLAGFARLSPVAIKRMSDATGIPIRDFFRPEVWKTSAQKHYSDSEIAFYYKRVQSECAALGLRFTTCYIGNGIKDYFQYQKLWSNRNDCCDAKGNVPDFTSSSQEIPWPKRVVFSRSKSAAEAARLEESVSETQFNSEETRVEPDAPGGRLYSFPQNSPELTI